LENGEGYDLNRVVVVDNASSDRSLEHIEDLRLPIEIVHNERNLGFAAACNRGGLASRASYLLFLNPDTLLYRDSLSSPISYLENGLHAKVGVCGVQLVDGEMNVARTCARFPSLSRFIMLASGLCKIPIFYGTGIRMSDWDHAVTRKVDHVIGAFYLVRRDVFRRLGGFDERFFVYLEDLDFSLRASREQWDTVYLATAKAYHAGGGTSQSVLAMRLFYSLRSRLTFASKHLGRWKTYTLLCVMLTIEPLARLGQCLARFDRSGIRSTLQAYGLLAAELRSLTVAKAISGNQRDENSGKKYM